MTLSRQKRGARTLQSLILGGLLWGCASSGLPLYSLDDPEVFRPERSNSHKLLVLRLVDRRPVSELEWENRVTDGKMDFIDRVTVQLGRHLAESGLFREVRVTLDRIESGTAIHDRVLGREGFDLVLNGELTHFSGSTDSEGNIEGRAAFEGLRLLNFHTGDILWKDVVDKRLKRKEKQPGPEFFYASEALRGAVNRLSQSLDRLDFSSFGTTGTRSLLNPGLKIGILIPADNRPEEERDLLLRRLKGDRYYSFYAGSSFWAKFLCGVFDKCDLPVKEDLNPLADQIAVIWVDKVRRLNLFSDVELIRFQSIKPGSLSRLRNLGYGAVITSKLTHSFGAVTPSAESEWFPVWSGGLANQQKFKAFSVTQIDQARLIDTETGEILWEGDGDFSYEKTFQGWRVPDNFLWFSIHGALDQLTVDLGDSISY